MSFISLDLIFVQSFFIVLIVATNVISQEFKYFKLKLIPKALEPQLYKKKNPINCFIFTNLNRRKHYRQVRFHPKYVGRLVLVRLNRRSKRQENPGRLEIVPVIIKIQRRHVSIEQFNYWSISYSVRDRTNELCTEVLVWKKIVKKDIRKGKAKLF